MRYIIILLFTFFFTYANTNISADYNETKELSNLIKSIKSAKGDDRRVKMNQLKLFLRSMNERKRIKVIAKVKRILQEGNRNINRPLKTRKSYIRHKRTPINNTYNNKVSTHTNPSGHINQPKHFLIPKNNLPSQLIPKTINMIKHPNIAHTVSPPVIPKPNINNYIQHIQYIQQNIQHVQEHILQNINNVQHMIRHNIQQNIPMKFFPIFK